MGHYCIKSYLFHFISSVFLILLFSSCARDESLPVTLDDKWEGQKDFIFCELESDKITEVTVYKTFNPIYSTKEPIQFVTDFEIIVYMNKAIFDTLTYNFNKNIYEGKKPILANNNYHIILTKNKEAIKSKTIYVQSKAYTISSILKNISTDSIKINVKLDFEDNTIGTLETNMFISAPGIFLIGSNIDRLPTSNSICFKNNNTLSLSCQNGEPFEMSLKAKYNNKVTIDSTNTVLVLMLKYNSPEISALKEGKLSPYFGLNKDNILKTSFDGAYGIFGFSQNTVLEEPIFK